MELQLLDCIACVLGSLASSESLYTCTFCQLNWLFPVQVRSAVFHHTLTDGALIPGQNPFLPNNAPAMSMFWAQHIMVQLWDYIWHLNLIFRTVFNILVYYMA